MILLLSLKHIKKKLVYQIIMSVLLPKNIDVKKIKYSEVKVMKSGAKSVYMNYDGSKVLLQTPVLNLPYGTNDNSKFIDKNDKGDGKKYDITLSFKGMQDNVKIQTFYDKMRELEEKIVDDAFTNRQLWFKNNYNNNKDVVSTMFTPMIKMDKDKETGEIANKYPPTFKVKLPYNTLEDKFEFDTYDMENNELDFSDIMNNLKGGKAQLIIQLNGIWFAGGMFGCSWKVVSGKFQQSNMSKVVFLEDSDVDKSDDEDDEVDSISADLDHVKETNQVPEEEEDIDEDAIEKEEKGEEEPIAPPVKSTKKATKKK